jgi:hypothetical protein
MKGMPVTAPVSIRSRKQAVKYNMNITNIMDSMKIMGITGIMTITL